MRLIHYGWMLGSLTSRNSEIGVGQHLFNYLATNHKEIGEYYRGTELDPYFDDDNVLPFLQDLLDKHVSL